MRGWIVKKRPEDNLRLILVNSKRYEQIIPLTQSRPDVAERLGVGVEQCFGFSIWLPPNLRRANIFCEVSGLRAKILRLDIDDLDVDKALPANVKPGVVVGEKEWLFLDRDTNLSRAQAEGSLILTGTCLKAWCKYYDRLAAVSRDMSIKSTFLITPSKERVMYQYHPDKVAKKGIAEQILDGFRTTDQVTYPLEELIKLGDTSFIKTDTHWTHRGALCAFRDVCVNLGIDMEMVDQCFAEDEWLMRDHLGDLGIKLMPNQKCQVEFNKNNSWIKYKTFDNGLTNFGRAIRLSNPRAVLNSTCMIFGSSSSYSMLGYAGRIFQNVVFVHSAASIDLRLLDAEKPRYLIAQTNERFLIKPADFRHDVVKMKTTKTAEKEFNIEHFKKNKIVPHDIQSLPAIYQSLLVSRKELETLSKLT